MDARRQATRVGGCCTDRGFYARHDDADRGILTGSGITRDRADFLLAFYAERIANLDYPRVNAAEEEEWGWSFFYDDTRLYAPGEMTIMSDGQSITFGASESDDGLMVWLGLSADIPRCGKCGENAMYCMHAPGISAN